MSDHAIFVGWGRPFPGREQAAIEVFGESVEYWKQLQQQGNIESFETFALTHHGGDLYGFAVLRGDPAKLAELMGREEFNRHTLRADVVVEHVGIVPAVSGETMKQTYALWLHEAEAITRKQPAFA